MTVEQVARVLNECELQGTPKLLLVGIANHDGDGGAWPAMDTLARYCSVDRRNVQRALTKLVEAGWIEIVPHGGGTVDWRDDHRPNLYRILWPERGGARATPNGAASPRERGGVSARHGAAHAPPELSKEPTSKRSARRAPADAAAASLPGMDRPQAVDAVGDDPMRVPWRLVREAFETRERKPIESRKAAAGVVRRLLKAGWSERQVAEALRSSPAWTPTSLQVELTRSGGKPSGRPSTRVPANRSTEEPSMEIWRPKRDRPDRD